MKTYVLNCSCNVQIDLTLTKSVFLPLLTDEYLLMVSLVEEETWIRVHNWLTIYLKLNVRLKESPELVQDSQNQTVIWWLKQSQSVSHIFFPRDSHSIFYLCVSFLHSCVNEYGLLGARLWSILELESRLNVYCMLWKNGVFSVRYLYESYRLCLNSFYAPSI